jgi:DNA-binding response OmpR family regulator
MKALIYVRDNKLERLKALLENEGLEIQAGTEVSHINPGPREESVFVLAIIDSRIKNAAPVCRSLREARDIPVALLIDAGNADWNRLQSMDVDCYLTETKDNNEMTARIRAILRRYTRKVQESGGREDITLAPSAC